MDDSNRTIVPSSNRPAAAPSVSELIKHLPSIPEHEVRRLRELEEKKLAEVGKKNAGVLVWSLTIPCDQLNSSVSQTCEL